MSEVLVIALGGNALQQGKGPADAESQLKVIHQTAEQLVKILEEGQQLAIVHGNGPQVGRIVLQNEAAANITPALPFDVCGALSQGMIGYHIQQALGEKMSALGLKSRPVTLITQVVVDKGDKAFHNPTKPIGPFYTKEEAIRLQEEKGYAVREDSGRGFRRVVASPIPSDIVELDAVKALLKAGFVPVTAGGGGIPVIKTATGYGGVAAVIDKDLAAWRLAEGLDAKTLLILTEVENACLNYGKENQRPIQKITAGEMRAYFEAGHFAAGSMGPKVDAALRFVEGGKGRRAVITRLDLAIDGLKGNCGTEILS